MREEFAEMLGMELETMREALQPRVLIEDLERRWTPADPDELDDDELDEEYDLLIGELARLCVFVDVEPGTSQREAYAMLVDRLYTERYPNRFCGIPVEACDPYDPVGAWLRYVATDEERAEWAAEFPGKALPEKGTPVQRESPVRRIRLARSSEGAP